MFKIIIKEILRRICFIIRKQKNKNIINSNDLEIDIIRISLYEY